jgi:putative transposase
MDNVFIERLWRSVKYEDIYLREYATLPALFAGLKRWFERYNTWRPHETLGNLTPDAVYQTGRAAPQEATAAGDQAA